MAEVKNYVDQAGLKTALEGVKTYVDGSIADIPEYELPKASATALGGIKLGTGLAIDGDGKVSVTGDAAVDPSALPLASDTAKGAVIVGEGLAIDEAGKLNLDVDVDAIAEAKAKAAVNEVVGGAPETYDTLKEIADYIDSHKSVETALNEAIGVKADKTEVTEAIATATAAIPTYSPYSTQDIQGVVADVFGVATEE